jgi:salicylate hydroxylase
MRDVPVGIAGAGIAGLAIALALDGRDTVVLEQAKAFSRLGAGLQLGPNAVRALQKLNAWDAVAPSTSSPPEIHIRDGVTGRLLKRMRLGSGFEKRFGAPYRVALRADLHEALQAVACARPNVELQHASSVTTATSVASGAVAVVNNKPQSFRFLIASDGVKSAIRQTLFPDAAPTSAAEVFHRAQVEIPSAAGVAMDCVNLWLYPRGHVVHYPVGLAQRLNIVAITPHNQTVESLYGAACASLNTVLRSAAREFTPWPGYFIKPLPQWVNGNIMLLGDAAHATLPYLAQGAAMALEDAAALHTALKRETDFASAAREIEAVRKPRTTRLHAATLAAGRIYHHGGLMRRLRNFGLQNAPAQMLEQRMAWIYGG